MKKRIDTNPRNSLSPHNVMKVLSDPDPLLGIIIKFKHPIMVDGYDGSDYSDEGNPHGYSQESSDSLPPLTFRTIWECPGITTTMAIC